jgi:pimeloyl-ACP methyl ester carboxylesterase
VTEGAQKFSIPNSLTIGRAFQVNALPWRYACIFGSMRLNLLAAILPFLAFGQIPDAPGQLVDAGGVKLHINCAGTGSPTVVLEAGFPGSSLDWSLVQPAVAQFTRVCSYDRAGFGWSRQGPLPRSSSRIAEELRALLSTAQIPGPYLLAGHSMGGLYVRAFARKFPEAVAGLVLIDGTHEDQWDYEPRRYWEPTTFQSIRLKQPEVARPQAVASVLKEMWASDQWKTAERAERVAIKITIAEAQKESKRLPVVPLVVLSAGEEIGWTENAAIAALKWQQLQREMAAFSPLGKWRPVPGANHYIHLSQPTVVADAIREAVQFIRNAKAIPASGAK